MIENITIGADIEVFLQDKESKKFISVVGLIGGTKDNPRKLTDRGHAVQEDNVAAEFNIPAVKTAEDFYNEIQVSLNGLKNLLPQNLDICLSSSAIFDADQLQTPEAQLFGCSADYEAYRMEQNSKPDTSQYPGLRSIGGHIHIGYTGPDMFINRDLIMMLDVTLGLPSLLLDTDKMRRSLYGKAGCFRPKNYGAEYRTLSSFWIKDKATIQWAFNGVIEAVRRINHKNIPDIDTFIKVRKSINTADTEMAIELMESLNIPIPNTNVELIHN